MMKSKEYIVIISEGEKTEEQIVENLRRNFFNSKKEIVFLSYKANIYHLFNEIKKIEEEIDIIGLLKEKDLRVGEKRRDIEKISLGDLKRDEVSQIYLFFDYDGHTKGASDEDIKKMIALFDNETKYGKLYISYPMVEAVKHLKRKTIDIKEYIVEAKENISYKKLVSENTDFENFTTFLKEDWYFIIDKTMERIKFLYELKNINYESYLENISQNNIFKKQYEKFLKEKNKVLVLGSFPFFLIEYFGEEFYNSSVSNAVDEK